MEKGLGLPDLYLDKCMENNDLKNEIRILQEILEVIYLYWRIRVQTEVIISKQEKFQAVRWLNLVIGLWQLYYWVQGSPWYTLAIGCLNIAVWTFTRHKKI